MHILVYLCHLLRKDVEIECMSYMKLGLIDCHTHMGHNYLYALSCTTLKCMNDDGACNYMSVFSVSPISEFRLTVFECGKKDATMNARFEASRSPLA